MTLHSPHVLASHFYTLSPRLVRRLRADFPMTCTSACEDATSSAILIGLESPLAVEGVWQKDGLEGLFRWLHVVAWRALRGKLRLASTKLEGSMEDETAGGGDPLVALLSREGLDRANALIDEAATRFGGRRATALGDALRTRFTEECTDGEAAAAHGVHRESVNRARSWMRQLGRLS